MVLWKLRFKATVRWVCITIALFCQCADRSATPEARMEKMNRRANCSHPLVQKVQPPFCVEVLEQCYARSTLHFDTFCWASFMTAFGQSNAAAENMTPITSSWVVSVSEYIKNRRLSGVHRAIVFRAEFFCRFVAHCHARCHACLSMWSKTLRITGRVL